MTSTAGDRDPLKAGIHARRVDQQQFLHVADWHRANDAREIVGSCRQPGCGGFLQAVDTHQAGGITWYGTECMNCGHETAAPEGRVLRRSGRHQEMPDGWWSQRMTLLRKLAQLSQPNGEAL